ncbi:MAG: hypothetical protein KL787_02970 [Taibaiella sp.]|nr:hypothetical protein [Taibaiella sp.]
MWSGDAHPDPSPSARHTRPRKEEELHYTLEGTAVNGVDYEYLDGIAIIPPGATSVQIPIIPISSPYLKGTKTVVPIIYSSMACMPDVFGDTIYIYDSLYLESTTFDHDHMQWSESTYRPRIPP